MADDTDQQGAADRRQVAAGEGYEVAYFARKHGLTQKAARALIAEVGNDRDKLDAAASSRRDTTPPARAKRAATSSARPSPRRTAAASRKPGGRSADKTPAGTEQGKPVTEAVAARAEAVVRAARRSSAAARQRVAAAPAAIGKRAGRALDATRSAATSRTAALIGVAAAGLVTGLAVNLGRKAAVQAPSLLAGDWFEALKAEHAMALAIVEQIEKTRDDEPAKRSTLLTQLKHALGKHAFTEENVIYPALRDWGDKADADKLHHDHGYVKQYLYELDQLDSASPAFLARVAAFRADLEAHIREEEDAVFPPLHAALGEARNAEITALANKEGFKLA